MTRAQQITYLNTVAAKYGLAPSTLIGVYGTESGYGANDGPSSAGALGPFQFEPATAASYGLSTGSGGTVWNFEDSAIAAAQYLSHLGANSNPGSPQTYAALNAYNGNQGGSSVTDYVKSVITNGLQLAPPTIGGVPGQIARGVGVAGTAILAPVVGLADLGAGTAGTIGAAEAAAGTGTGVGSSLASGLGGSAISAATKLATAGGLAAFIQSQAFLKVIVFVALLGLSAALAVTAFRRTAATAGASS